MTSAVRVWESSRVEQEPSELTALVRTPKTSWEGEGARDGAGGTWPPDSFLGPGSERPQGASGLGQLPWPHCCWECLSQRPA